jgi:hypothetical protein
MFNLDDWPDTPRRVIFMGRILKLGGFRSQPKSFVTVVDSSGWNRRDVPFAPTGP